ncbi:MAG: hypothetical protein K6F56_09585, partial [Oscillospiraceae bacterium]|nr:hypothetical protein [Oscillospiraceae bacterium]
MKKILSILLTLCLILCLAPVTAQAEGAVHIIREGETLEEVAAGEYVENHGTVVTNNGTVIENHGTVSNNLGTVTENYGTVINNNGTVTNNYKDVTYNKSGSIIEANCSDGYVYG